jgi:hypothetical protein
MILIMKSCAFGKQSIIHFYDLRYVYINNVRSYVVVHAAQ